MIRWLALARGGNAKSAHAPSRNQRRRRRLVVAAPLPLPRPLLRNLLLLRPPASLFVVVEKLPTFRPPPKNTPRPPRPRRLRPMRVTRPQPKWPVAKPSVRKPSVSRKNCAHGLIGPKWRPRSRRRNSLVPRRSPMVGDRLRARPRPLRRHRIVRVRVPSHRVRRVHVPSLAAADSRRVRSRRQRLVAMLGRRAGTTSVPGAEVVGEAAAE